MSIRVVVLSLCFGLMIISPAFSQEKIVALEFDELLEFAAGQSLTIQIIERTYDLAENERKMNLQWSNPELSYSREDAAGDLEQFVTLDKQFEMPWVYASRKRGANAQLESEKYRKEEQIVQTMSSLKSGYIELKLLETQLEFLKQIKDMIVNLSDVSQDQFKEGMLSGVDKHLIQLSLVNINANLNSVNLIAQLKESEWKTDIGIAPESLIKLLTSIKYQPLQLEPFEYYQSLISNAPGYQQRKNLKLAIESKIQMERRSVIPHFNLFGGSKIVESESDGYVAGISIPVPLSNQSRLAVQKMRIELEKASAELEQYQRNMQGRVKILISTIRELGASLAMAESQLSNNKEMVESVQTSYMEGWISLIELLNAIALQIDATQEFYRQLTDYYRSVFQLEEIIGETLVTFSPQNGVLQ